MNIYTTIFSILLIVYQVNSSCPVGSNQLDDQCSTYCYQVVKPLLQYVNTIKSMTLDHNELLQKIKVQAETINNLKMQSELSESHNINQKKLIDQYEMQITNLKLEIKSKDTDIKDLRSENLKTNELQDLITGYRQASSCLGKLTQLHAIRVPIAQTMTVPCDSNLAEAGAGWTVIQRRIDGSVNFNRGWSEYKEGFGDLRGEFFIGLEKLYVLTQHQPYELFISLMDFEDEKRYAKYNYFVIGNEAEFYKLKELGTYSGNAGDAMKFQKNKMFSTADRYNHTSGTCAKSFRSGWWFSSCYNCNLNGPYAHSNTDEDIKSIDWNAWKEPPMKFAQMMIRPKLF